MPLEGQWERQHTPVRFDTPKARWILGIGTVVVIALVAALVLSGVGSKTAVKPGCISLTLASTTGGAQFHACGADARQWCLQQGRQASADAAKLRAACRREGYPIS
jgi:hypothetical protein